MNRKLKTVGMALVAVLALAFSASSALAAEFHSETAETVLSGSQIGEDVFTTDAGTVKCTEATYAGLTSKVTETTQTVTPTYSGCTAFGFVGAKIDVNGCQYKFAATTATTGTIEICPGGQTIVVTASTCDVKVTKQGPLTGVTYANEGSGTTKDVKVTVNLTGLKYSQEGTGSFLPCTTASGKTNGKYTGAATVIGKTTAGAHTGVNVA